MDYTPLYFAPEMHALRYSSDRRLEAFPDALRLQMAEVRERFLLLDAHLEQEEALTRDARNQAARITGIDIPRNEWEEAWRTMLPEFERLRSERDALQLNYVLEIQLLLQQHGLLDGGSL